MKKLLGRCLLRNTCPNTAQCRLGIVDIDRQMSHSQRDRQLDVELEIDR